MARAGHLVCDSEIADLRAQLRQAQELIADFTQGGIPDWRPCKICGLLFAIAGVHSDFLMGPCLRCLRQERNAAIERGVQAWHQALYEAELAEGYRLAGDEYVAGYREQRALAHRRLVLLCNIQSHTTVSADIIRMIDKQAEAPILPAEAQAEVRC